MERGWAEFICPLPPCQFRSLVCSKSAGESQSDHNLSAGGERCKSCRAKQTGGFSIEIKRCSRMSAQDRSWRHRTDFSLEAELYRLRFPRIRNDSNDFFGLEDL